MEKEIGGENQSKISNLMAKTPNWLDLPSPITTNIILEHLEIVDYIIFSAVCKEWQRIQKEHQNRCSPYPPPLPLSFPWLRSVVGTSNSFYLPNKQELYEIAFCTNLEIAWHKYCKHGWLLLLRSIMLDKSDRCLCIYNPITGVRIDLPALTLKTDNMVVFCTAEISSQPSDPDCTIFIMYSNGEGYFCRLNDNNGWQIIGGSDLEVHKITIFNSKIYTISKCYTRIYIVDTLLSDPIAHVLKMDCSEICTDLRFPCSHLLNILGELVMVIIERSYSTEHIQYGKINDFHIYRADFLKNKWLRMESLGDHALFYSCGNIFSLPAVAIGCKVNNVYCAACFFYREVAWAAFDLSAKEWTDGHDRGHFNILGCSWFLPTLDYYNAGKINGA